MSKRTIVEQILDKAGMSVEPVTTPKRPCLSCVESGQPSAKWHDKGCRDDSAYRNKSIQWVKVMKRLQKPQPKWEGFSFMPKGEVV